jgi:hypothetical protein
MILVHRACSRNISLREVKLLTAGFCMRKPPQETNVHRGHSCALRDWPLAVRECGTCIIGQRAETLYATCKLLACRSSRVFGDASSYSNRGRDRRKPQRAGLPYWGARPAQHVRSTGTLLLIDNFVDQASATLRLKPVFGSEDEKRWPGVFVKAAGEGCSA